MAYFVMNQGAGMRMHAMTRSQVYGFASIPALSAGMKSMKAKPVHAMTTWNRLTKNRRI